MSAGSFHEHRWQDEAVCKGATHLFTSAEQPDIERAKRICAGCPVIAPCRVAGEYEAGVWGGTDEGDRRRSRRLRLGA